MNFTQYVTFSRTLPDSASQLGCGQHTWTPTRHNICFTRLPRPCIQTSPHSRSHSSQGPVQRERDTASCPQADTACGCRAIRTALSFVCVCVSLRKHWIDSFDHCSFKKKVFSFCGSGGLSLLLGSQYNYQRLQAVLLPGIECLSQGYYYFSCAALWQSDTTFE